MNKIELIKKSIEDKTGTKVEVVINPVGDISFFTKFGVWKISPEILELLPISDPLEEQPTCPCTILDEPCTPHCTCKEPFSSRGCYLCARYGSEEQRKAKAKWIKERVMSTVLEEQPDKGWIPVKCPVCGGNGIVDAGFYTVPLGRTYTGTSASPEQCRSCKGSGIIHNSPHELTSIRPFSFSEPTKIPGQ